MPLPFPATFSARVGMPDCALQDPLLRKFFEMRTEIAWILKVASHAIEHYEHRPEIQRLLVMYFDDNYEHDYIWTTLDSLNPSNFMWMIAKDPRHFTSHDPQPANPIFPETQNGLKEVMIRFSTFFDENAGWTYEDSTVITLRADLVLRWRLFRELDAAITIRGTNFGTLDRLLQSPSMALLHKLIHVEVQTYDWAGYGFSGIPRRLPGATVAAPNSDHWLCLAIAVYLTVSHTTLNFAHTSDRVVVETNTTAGPTAMGYFANNFTELQDQLHRDLETNWFVV